MVRSSRDSAMASKHSMLLINARLMILGSISLLFFFLLLLASLVMFDGQRHCC